MRVIRSGPSCLPNFTSSPAHRTANTMLHPCRGLCRLADKILIDIFALTLFLFCWIGECNAKCKVLQLIKQSHRTASSKLHHTASHTALHLISKLFVPLEDISVSKNGFAAGIEALHQALTHQCQSS